MSGLITAWGVLVAALGATPHSFSYPDGSTLTVQLVGEAGDAARVVFTPSGAQSNFTRCVLLGVQCMHALVAQPAVTVAL